MEQESSTLSMGVASKSGFSLLFLASTVNDLRRKLHMVKIHLTVGKRAKRMPDATVQTQ